MGEMPIFRHRVPQELKDELAELEKIFGGPGKDFLRHLVDLYRRELNGEFEESALGQIAATTVTELQGASKQITALSSSAHDLLTQLYRSKDIAMEIVTLRAELKEKEDMIREYERELQDKDVLIDNLKKINTEEIKNIERQHKIELEERILRQRKEFQEVLSSNTQKHQQEMKQLLTQMQNSLGWKLFGRKKKEE